MVEVTIVSPEKVIFEGKARSVILPWERGVFEILSYHKPLLSRLVKGKLIVDSNVFPISRGIVGIHLNKATIVVEE